MSVRGSVLGFRDGGESHPAQFGFKLQKEAGGWQWMAYDPLGRVTESGQAATKSEAAALIIRALART